MWSLQKQVPKIKDTSEQLCELYDGEVPDSLEKLIKLPGVGRKTAGVVLSNAFNHPAIAVDTHVFRVSNRIGIVDEPNPQNRICTYGSYTKRKMVTLTSCINFSWKKNV